MTRGRVIAIIAAGALGAAAVAAGYMLAQRENRDRLAEQTTTMTKRAREVSDRALKTAKEQYQTVAPKAREAVSSVLAQAPQAVDTLSARLPKPGVRA